MGFFSDVQYVRVFMYRNEFMVYFLQFKMWKSLMSCKASPSTSPSNSQKNPLVSHLSNVWLKSVFYKKCCIIVVNIHKKNVIDMKNIAFDNLKKCYNYELNATILINIVIFLISTALTFCKTILDSILQKWIINEFSTNINANFFLSVDIFLICSNLSNLSTIFLILIMTSTMFAHIAQTCY